MLRRSLSRRTIVRTLALGATALATRRAQAAAAKLDVKDPAAVALGYVLNAADVDVKKFPSYVKGSNCENCLQLQGTTGSPYRPCATFKGELVAVAGWCSAWTAEM